MDAICECCGLCFCIADDEYDFGDDIYEHPILCDECMVAAQKEGG